VGDGENAVAHVALREPPSLDQTMIGDRAGQGHCI
jgi:hypothetical protein